ncbi:PLP-dependent transferase [Hortaea werneckii]|nr:PLP-dependent transferase [Hortaea werneckii]KAI6825237.1 PLP-dependent transferase [Hortaea werneckii]KAI6922420.1 PLP-dependent transferase [Hortaea werneckii]KAI6929806.1 PLP-dependent transferase [Hortaea werneckii]KAI6964191.1 PLP-dependent transferase [Hortaea werneckii]
MGLPTSRAPIILASVGLILLLATFFQQLNGIPDSWKDRLRTAGSASPSHGSGLGQTHGSASSSGAPSFYSIALSHGTDKVTKHHYHHMYQKYLDPVRETRLKLLEIGLGCDMSYGPGASYYTWLEYLPNVDLYYIEYDAACAAKWAANTTAATIFSGDQANVEFLQRFMREAGTDFDVIIDDGGHQMNQQITSLQYLWQAVKPGGIYFCEDLQTSYWENYGGDPSNSGKKTTMMDEAEAVPDKYIRYDNPKYLDESREAVAKYLNAPTSACVFVPNATTGLNTVLRSLVFKPEDVIIYFATIYGACEKTVEYIKETTPAKSHKIAYEYPVSDDYLCSSFEEAVKQIRADGLNPKIAIFDTIVSMPGVRMPFERLTALCHQHNVLSCIDGAHGIGHIPLDISTLDPDFFFSNCHKWLHVPRGCAVFYAPERNQDLIRTTLPTSWGFVEKAGKTAPSPLPPNAKSPYVALFEYTATTDNAPYLCVPAALQWRKNLSWKGKQGEEAVMGYGLWVAQEGAKLIAKSLGTEVMDNDQGTLTKCMLQNIRLPLSLDKLTSGDAAQATKIAQWIAKVQVDEYNMFVAIYFYAGSWWVRVSGQVYLTLEDFEYGAKALEEICQRVEKGEWKV